MNRSPPPSGGDPYPRPTAAVAPPVALTTPERISRAVLGIEALVLLAPVSALAALWMVLATLALAEGGGAINRDERVLTAIVAGCCVVLAATWWTVGSYLRHGRAGLVRMRRWPLALLDFAAVVTTAGTALWALDSFHLADLPAWTEPAHILVLGSPVLVPYLHLAVERWRSRAPR